MQVKSGVIKDIISAKMSQLKCLWNFFIFSYFIQSWILLVAFFAVVWSFLLIQTINQERQKLFITDFYSYFKLLQEFFYTLKPSKNILITSKIFFVPLSALIRSNSIFFELASCRLSKQHSHTRFTWGTRIYLLINSNEL